MKESELYLRAAKRIASGKEMFSCNAIHGGFRHDDPVVNKYARVMRGELGLLCTSDISSFVEQCLGCEASFSDITTGPEARHFRVMLLCMMAACCEDVK